MIVEEMLEVIKNEYSKEIIVGIFSGLILLIIQFLYKYIKNILTYNKYRGYIGKYYTYTISTKKNRNITCYAYSIRLRLGRLILVSNNKGLKYKGEVKITDKNIYFYASGAEHEEYTHMVFHKPLNNKLSFSIGVFSGVSVLNEPTSKIILITNKKILPNKAQDILNKYEYINENLLNIIPISEYFYLDEIEREWRSAQWLLEPVDGGFFRINSYLKEKQYLHIQNGAIESSEPESSWWSAQWSLEIVDKDYYRLNNRWKKEQYLHIQNNVIESSEVKDSWWSAHWTLEPVNEECYRLKNRWKEGQYLHIQNGIIESGEIDVVGGVLSGK